MEAQEQLPVQATPQLESSRDLARQWRTLSRVATLVAVLTSPALYLALDQRYDWTTWKTIAVTFLAAVAFRGTVDVITRRLIPWPSLFGDDETAAKQEDVVNRRRAWFWRFWVRLFLIYSFIVTAVWIWDI